MDSSTRDTLLNPKEWPDALTRKLQVPMQVRSTSRIGVLAAPQFLSGFIRLAFAAGLGIIGAASQRPYLDPQPAIQKAADFSDDARKEALQATGHKQTVRGARIDQRRASRRQQPAIADLQAKIRLELDTADKKLAESVERANTAADSASTAAKQARLARLAGEADKQRALAEAAFLKAKTASDEAGQVARQAVLLGNIATALANGNTPDGIADQARRMVAQHLKVAEDADKKALEAEAKVGLDRVDLSNNSDRIEEALAKASEALATIEEAQKIVAALGKHVAQADTVRAPAAPAVPPVKKHRRRGRRVHLASAVASLASAAAEPADSAHSDDNSGEAAAEHPQPEPAKPAHSDDNPGDAAAEHPQPAPAKSADGEANTDEAAAQHAQPDSAGSQPAGDAEADDVFDDELAPAAVEDDLAPVERSDDKQLSPTERIARAEKDVAEGVKRAEKAVSNLAKRHEKTASNLKLTTEQQDRAAETKAAVTSSAANTSALTFLGFFAWLVGRFAAGRAKKQSDRRLQTLPFSVLGLAKTMDGTTRSCRSVQVRVVFQSAPPATLRDRLAAFDSKAQLSAQADAIVITRSSLQGFLDYTNHRAFRWTSRLLVEALVPLHTQCPIKRVEVSSAEPTDSEEEEDQEDDQEASADATDSSETG